MTEEVARLVYVPPADRRPLASKTVVIVGVGGLGSEVARLLAQAGVGRLALCDPDKVEESNLGRGALFAADDVGSLKVEVARRALAVLAPGTVTETRADDFRYGIGLSELRSAAATDSGQATIKDIGGRSLADIQRQAGNGPRPDRLFWVMPLEEGSHGL